MRTLYTLLAAAFLSTTSTADAKSGFYLGADANYGFYKTDSRVFSEDTTNFLSNNASSDTRNINENRQLFDYSLYFGYLFNVASNFHVGPEFGIIVGEKVLAKNPSLAVRFPANDQFGFTATKRMSYIPSLTFAYDFPNIATMLFAQIGAEISNIIFKSEVNAVSTGDNFKSQTTSKRLTQARIALGVSKELDETFSVVAKVAHTFRGKVKPNQDFPPFDDEETLQNSIKTSVTRVSIGFTVNL